MAGYGGYERKPPPPPSALAARGAVPSILIQVAMWLPVAEAEGKEPGVHVPERYLPPTRAHISVVCIRGN